MLAIIGGRPEQFVPFIKLYRKAAENAGRDPQRLPLGINNHFYVGSDSRKAADEFYPYYAKMMNRVGRERGWPPLSREMFEYSRSPDGALMVGSVQETAEKILREHELFGNTRFLAQASVGNVPHALVMKSIELFGSQVVPLVKKALG